MSWNCASIIIPCLVVELLSCGKTGCEDDRCEVFLLAFAISDILVRGISLLADMTAALGDRVKLASLTWNDLTIASPYCGVKTVGKTAEEKAAANLFKTLNTVALLMLG